MEIAKSPKKYRSLNKISTEKKAGKEKIWAGSYIVLALIFIVLYFLLRLDFFNILGNYKINLSKFSAGAFAAMLILSAGKIAEAIILKKSHSASGRYNLIRMVRLICVLLIIFVLVSFLF